MAIRYGNKVEHCLNFHCKKLHKSYIYELITIAFKNLPPLFHSLRLHLIKLLHPHPYSSCVIYKPLRIEFS
jgi:hypothetical protein